MKNKIIDIRAIPYSLSDFAKQAGIDAAIKLCKEYGGLSKYIPGHLDMLADDHWLVKCVGREATQVLSSLYGNDRIDIPNIKYAYAKKAEIAFAKGSSNEVARRFNVTSRYVRMCRSDFGVSTCRIKKTIEKTEDNS